MGDTDALRDKLRDAVFRCVQATIGKGFVPGIAGVVVDLDEVLDAVLPVIQDHQWALREQADRQAQATINANITLSLLRSRVEALADELDNEVQTITNRDAGALGRRGALRDAAQRIRRSLSDNKEQQP